jgi:poly(3-hydroxybutyrate) depolymerase
MRIRDWRDAGGLVARLVEIDGLGHAWSGGNATLRFNDAQAPDALAMVGEFLRDIRRPSATMRFWRRSAQ